MLCWFFDWKLFKLRQGLEQKQLKDDEKRLNRKYISWISLRQTRTDTQTLDKKLNYFIRKPWY